jgi:flagellar biosynthetic protein FliQ
MGLDFIGNEINTSFMTTLALVGPLMLIATVLGLLIAILQAATQIQEQTISQVAKVFAISFAMILAGPFLAAPLVSQAEHLFNDFPSLVR